MQIEEITISPKDIPTGARVFAINNTADYNGKDSVFGIIVIAVKSKEELLEWGFRTDELDAVWQLENGEKFDSLDYGNSANIIRLS